MELSGLEQDKTFTLGGSMFPITEHKRRQVTASPLHQVNGIQVIPPPIEAPTAALFSVMTYQECKMDSCTYT